MGRGAFFPSCLVSITGGVDTTDELARSARNTLYPRRATTKEVHPTNHLLPPTGASGISTQGRRHLGRNINVALPSPRHSNEPTRRRKTIPYLPCPRNTIHQRKNKDPRRIPYRPGLSPHSWNTNHNNPTPTGEVSKSQHHRHVQPSLKQKHAPTKNEHHMNANTRHHPAHPGASSFKNNRATSS